MINKIHFLSLAFILSLIICCSEHTSNPSTVIETNKNDLANDSFTKDQTKQSILDAVFKENSYTTKDSVAAYICKFSELPQNYVNKNEGINLYNESGKTFEKWNFNPLTTLGVMIGGDKFTNAENLLSKDSYNEADVDYNGNNRGTKRLIYAKNCTIYYTADHYEHFTKLEFN